MIKYLIPFIFSMVVCIVLTPLVRKLSFKCGAIDKPNKRKVHSGAIPCLGGLAIYLAFFITTFLFIGMVSEIKGIFYGSLIILLFGLVDDIKGISAKSKLAGQIIATIPVILYGIEINFISNLQNGLIFLGYLSVPITVFWIVGMINSINLTDGLDGLAGGIVFIATISIAVVAIGFGREQSAILAFILAGSTLGFLKYNFNPASIFMGDTGSMFLGYTLATISIMGALKSLTVISFLVPVIILGVPIIDTALAILRRISNDSHPFKADKKHIHHRFLEFGLNQKQAVLSIYLVSIIFGASGILLAQFATAKALLLIAFIMSIVFLWLKEFKIIELERKYVFNCLNILIGIKSEIEKMNDSLTNDEVVPKLDNELIKLEQFLNRLPSYIEGDGTDVETSIVSTKTRVSILDEVIEEVIKLYKTEPENINYLFDQEKEKLIEVYDNIKKVG